ncbi:MAG TPA: ATP-binding protein [Acidimicrobiales bacterium]
MRLGCTDPPGRCGHKDGSLPESVTLHLPPAAASAREARRRVRTMAAGWPSECCATLQVLVDELVTNAILHARTDTTLVARIDGTRARVEVHDQSTLTPQPRHYGGRSVTGRGLHLVEALAHRWGVDRVDGGKVVWFELECAPQRDS